MGVCLGEVSDHQQHHRKRAPPPGFVLYHQYLAAQEVKKQSWVLFAHGIVFISVLEILFAVVFCRYLEYCLDPKKKDLVNVATVLSTVAGNVVGFKLAWNFIRQHWKHIKDR